METELEYLESRVAALIDRLTEVHDQNTRLAEALAQALKENAELTFRLEDTKFKVAALIERLPKQEDEA
ncbi:hypothetical protein OL229_12085 [Neisseriaceae bacterium JH1-16]|nr:hypothetical protein [Neisseriaceae bacterium JH1-16]